MTTKHYYTDKQLKWVERNQSGITRQQLLDKFNHKFKTSVSFTSMVNFCARHSLKNGLQGGQFSKGIVPWNKGVKGYMGANVTSFKKGQAPVNHRPVGSERICSKDGYILVKIAEPKTWQLKHIVEWEKVNSKLPTKHCIRFLDLNRTNCKLDNLMCIPRGVNAMVNKSNPADTDCSTLNKAIILNEQVKYTINNVHQLREQL
jgi:hypothetical protein